MHFFNLLFFLFSVHFFIFLFLSFSHFFQFLHFFIFIVFSFIFFFVFSFVFFVSLFQVAQMCSGPVVLQAGCPYLPQIRKAEKPSPELASPFPPSPGPFFFFRLHFFNSCFVFRTLQQTSAPERAKSKIIAVIVTLISDVMTFPTSHGRFHKRKTKTLDMVSVP